MHNPYLTVYEGRCSLGTVQHLKYTLNCGKLAYPIRKPAVFKSGTSDMLAAHNARNLPNLPDLEADLHML